MVAPALSLRDDVVDGVVAERKQHAATVAHPFRPSVERVLVGPVVRKLTEVRAPESRALERR